MNLTESTGVCLRLFEYILWVHRELVRGAVAGQPDSGVQHQGAVQALTEEGIGTTRCIIRVAEVGSTRVYWLMPVN